MRANRVACGLLIGVCALASARVDAHGVRLSAQSQGDSVVGLVRYADDQPLRAARVELRVLPELSSLASLSPSGQSSGKAAVAWQTIANDAGEFVFEGVGSGDYQLSAADGLGHRASLRVSVAPGAASLTEVSNEPVRGSDVIAGLGYIVGFFGLLAWMSSRRVLRSRGISGRS